MSFIFSNLKKKTSKYFHFLFCASCVAAVAFSPIKASAAVQDVSVTNWPTSFTVTNVTWDQRLNLIQTALQDIRSYSNTIMNRFGWNGTYNFSQGFELLYNDVHSLATASTNSDILTAFDREFPVGSGTLGTMKSLISNFRLNVLSALYSGYSSGYNNTSIYATSLRSALSAESIDSKLTSVSNNLVDVPDIADDVADIRTYAYNTSQNSSLIKVNTDNISYDTANISSNTDSMALLLDDIDVNTTYLPGMYLDLNQLKEFFADDDTMVLKEAAEDTTNSALSDFTGDGSGAASAQDYSVINDTSDLITSTFSSGSNVSTAINYMNGSDRSPLQWFSQDTYNAFHPGTVSTMSAGDQDLSQYPYLQNYYNDIYNALGIQ